MCWRTCCAAFLFASATLPAQSVAISTLSAPNGSAGTILLKLESPAGKVPAAIQWTFVFPASITVTGADLFAGSAAESAEKTLACAPGSERQPGGETVYRCILYGGRRVILNGVLATVPYRANRDTSKASRLVKVQDVLAADAEAKPLPIANAQAEVAMK